MTDKSTIEWTDATWTDRSGRRTRTYTRQDPSRPGQRERRAQASLGRAWCRGCRSWLPITVVDRRGACQPCLNAEYRTSYAADGATVRDRVSRRRRGVPAVPPCGAEYLTEQADGRCAYCPALAETWDHVIPIAVGGGTVLGNIVPACRPCNSSKRDQDVFIWLTRTGRIPADFFVDMLMVSEVSA